MHQAHTQRRHQRARQRAQRLSAHCSSLRSGLSGSNNRQQHCHTVHEYALPQGTSGSKRAKQPGWANRVGSRPPHSPASLKWPEDWKHNNNKLDRAATTHYGATTIGLDRAATTHYNALRCRRRKRSMADPPAAPKGGGGEACVALFACKLGCSLAGLGEGSVPRRSGLSGCGYLYSRVVQCV